MADQSDVSNALVAAIAAACYPNGTGQACALSFPVRIYAGWPPPEALDADMKAGIAHATVWPRESRQLPLLDSDWKTQTEPVITITATVVGQTVTIGGTITAGNIVSVFANGKPYPYSIQQGNTLAGIAASLAALIAADIPGTNAAGAVLTLPASVRGLVARLGGQGTAIRNLRRTAQRFQVTAWGNCYDVRDKLAALIDVALADIKRVALPDGTSGTLHYQSDVQGDSLQKQRIYKRDLFYVVDFNVTQIQTQTSITQVQLTAAPSVGGSVPVTTYQ
ncbi:hypothetical protein [Chitinimonas naiadis]